MEAQIETEDDSLTEMSEETSVTIGDGMLDDALLDSLIETQIDSIVHYADTLSMTPEQRWVWHLQQNVETVIRRKHTMQVTTRVSKRSRRTVTRTIELPYTVGCCIYDLTADSMVYTHNPDKMMTPASTQKLFVSISALSTIGHDYDFRTEVRTDGNIVQDSLGHPYYKGDIYVCGGFDPTLRFSPIRQIADSIKAMGADSIDGRIIAYVPQKQSLLSHHGWTWERIPAGEEHFITPLTFNKGMTSPDVPREPVWTTIGRGRRARKVLTTPAFRSVRVRHPEQYFVASICKLLKVDSIAFSANDPSYVMRNDTTIDLTKRPCITSIRTPLTTVLSTMMKRSDNFYAESMLLNLSNPWNRNSWTYDRCRQAVRDMVTRAEGRPDDYLIVDGSGLSHSNKTTASLEIQILRYAFLYPEIYQPLYESLPIAGTDGTISKRMKSGNVFENVRAKTGTLNGVSALSGYVTASNGHEMAFSILVNNISSQAIGHALQDEICVQIAK